MQHSIIKVVIQYVDNRPLVSYQIEKSDGKTLSGNIKCTNLMDALDAMDHIKKIIGEHL